MRHLLVAATVALCLFVMTINVAVAKPKASAGQEAVTRPLPLLVALSATNGSLGTGADGATSLTLTGLDDLALRVSGGEAIPMTLPVFVSAFDPLFGGKPVNGLLSVGSADQRVPPPAWRSDSTPPSSTRKRS